MTLAKPVRRVLVTLPVLWVVVSVVFLLIHLVPGDPIVQMLGEGATASDVSPCAIRTGWMRRWERSICATGAACCTPTWASRCAARLGDAPRPQRYPYTLALTLAALLIGIAVSLPAGVFSALHRGRWPDRVLGVVSLGGLSFPNFALGPILILIFSIELGWLPVSGAGTGGLRAASHSAGDHAGQRAGRVLTRMVRTAMLEELGQDYIRTARAKGLSERTVVYRHALGNALIPVLTVLGLQFGSLLAGAIVTETIFSWPGIGRLTLRRSPTATMLWCRDAFWRSG